MHAPLIENLIFIELLWDYPRWGLGVVEVLRDQVMGEGGRGQRNVTFHTNSANLTKIFGHLRGGHKSDFSGHKSDFSGHNT